MQEVRDDARTPWEFKGEAKNLKHGESLNICLFPTVHYKCMGRFADQEVSIKVVNSMTRAAS